MSLQIEVISKELVKPSSPTPKHLCHYNFSFLDQLAPQINNSMVYFFHADDVIDVNHASDLLKRSLSQVLTHFYPLAGRIVAEKLMVDCNDDGVPFVETKVTCNLSHVMEKPDMAFVNKLLPYDMDEVVDTVLGVQFNVFDCGGIALGVCLSHKIGDALSYFNFIRSWVATACGKSEEINTHFQSSTLFPPKDLSKYKQDSSTPLKGKFVCKRFVFEEDVIESLGTKYFTTMKNILEVQKPPSRIATISTFLWTRLLAATKKVELEREKIQLVGYAVNLRPRMDPPLPEYAFGNYSWYLRTFPILDEQGECKSDLASLLRKELSQIHNDFFVSLRKGEIWNPVENREELAGAIQRGEMVAVSFTSLSRLPVNEVDFGWGSPVFVVPTMWKIKNFVILKDTILGNGIETYVSLNEDDMAKFERDVELVTHVSTMGLK